MSNWNGLVLTKKGQLLQAKVGTGIVLALTKMKLGSGVLPEGTALEDLTDLVTPEQNVGIAAKEVLTEQKMCKISATITNVGLSAGYYVRELGVFANDPDDGEILYAVTSDSAPDYLPEEGGSTAVSQEFAVYIAASNASDVNVSIDTGALATMGYVQLSINTHNEDPASHPDIREKITNDINAHNALETAHPSLDFIKSLSVASDGIHYRTRNGKSDQVLDLINQLQATLSQNTVPNGNTGTLVALLSGIVHQIKALSGKSNWWDTPKNNFETLSAGGVVAGNVSNANAWWVKLGGAVPLIIQGVTVVMTGNWDTVRLPISANNYFAIASPVTLTTNHWGGGANAPVSVQSVKTDSIIIAIPGGDNQWKASILIIGTV